MLPAAPSAPAHLPEPMALLARLRNLARLLKPGGPRAADVDAAEARRLQEEKGAVILDVRERSEWQRARVPGAVHVPLVEVESRLAELPKDRPVVVHCALGGRSALAAKRLSALGYKDVRNLRGGIKAWARAGLRLDRGDPPR